MKRFIRTALFLVFLVIVTLNISCEKSTGDFVFNQAENWKNVIVVPIPADTDQNKIKDFKEAIIRDASILQISALSDIPTKSSSKVNITFMGMDESKETEAHIIFIDYGFIKTLGLNLAGGRDFSKDFSNDTTSLIINNELERILGSQSGKSSLMGYKLSFSYKSRKYQGQIVGVIRNYRIRVDNGKIIGSVPMIFKLSEKQNRYIAVLTTKISAAINLLQNKWDELNFITPFEMFFLNDKVPDYAKKIDKNKTIKLYVIDGILSLFILIVLLGLLINRNGTIGRLFQMSGRINRIKFLLWILLINIVTYLLIYIKADMQSNAPVIDVLNGISIILFVISGLLSVIIGCFLLVKRFHDLDRPGSHFWLLLIPIYNIYLALILYFKRGTVGANRYGEDPIVAS